MAKLFVLDRGLKIMTVKVLLRWKQCSELQANDFHLVSCEDNEKLVFLLHNNFYFLCSFRCFCVTIISRICNHRKIFHFLHSLRMNVSWKRWIFLKNYYQRASIKYESPWKGGLRPKTTSEIVPRSRSHFYLDKTQTPKMILRPETISENLPTLTLKTAEKIWIWFRKKTDLWRDSGLKSLLQWFLHFGTITSSWKYRKKNLLKSFLDFI